MWLILNIIMRKSKGLRFKNMNVKLSIIVPAYNAEKYLEDCLNSILASTYRDFEILLVDDGSTDRTPEICDRYQQNYPQIRVFHTENRQLPSARNLGIDNANGRYISFVDADDLVSISLFEHMVRGLESGTDLSMCCFLRCPREFEGINTTEHICPTIILPDEAAQKMVSVCGPYVWNRLYKKEILEINSIRFFQDAQGAEDLSFNAKYLTHCKSVAFIDIPLYAYITTDGSITNTFRTNRIVSDRYVSLPRAARYASEVLPEISPQIAEEYRARAAMYYQTVLRKLENPSHEYICEAVSYVRKNRGALLRHVWSLKYYCSALVLCTSYRLWSRIFRIRILT